MPISQVMESAAWKKVVGALGGVRQGAVTRTKSLGRSYDALIMLEALLGRWGLEELCRRLSYVEAFSPNGHKLPPELFFGMELESRNDGEGNQVAVIFPHRRRRKWRRGVDDSAQVTAVFYHPRNFASLIFGDEDLEMAPQTRLASFLLPAVPASADRFNNTRLSALKRAVPAGCRPAFRDDFITPLSGIVVPRGDVHHSHQRRYAVLAVPYALAKRQFKDELTAILDARASSPGEYAALASAAWFGRPVPKPFEGSAEEVVWRAVPLDPEPAKGRFEGDGESFAYFYLEPRYDREGRALKGLLKLNVDYRVQVLLIHNDPHAQVLARVRDNAPGRVAWVKRQLERHCGVVKPIGNPADVVRAMQSFQPAGIYYEGFGHFPLQDVTWLLQGMTATLSRPRMDGDVHLGRERGGAPFLFQLGDGQQGGIMHLALSAKGTGGKTFLANLLGAEIGGVRQLAFNLNTSAEEAFPAICYRWGLPSEARSLEDYTDPETSKTRPGIHFICQHPEGEKPGIREWVMQFTTTQERDLETVFREDVIPAVRIFLLSLDLREDWPISIRPLPGCNPALAAAAFSLIWTGIDPWGGNQCAGFYQMWKEFAGSEDHMVLRIGDLYRLPEYRPEDPSDLASRFGHRVRRMLFDATSGDHKDNVHVIADDQTQDGFNIIKGGLDRFHLVCDLEREVVDGVKRFMIRVFDPKHLDELVAELIGTVDNPALCRLLSRREKESKD